MRPRPAFLRDPPAAYPSDLRALPRVGLGARGRKKEAQHVGNMLRLRGNPPNGGLPASSHAFIWLYAGEPSELLATL